MNTTQQIPWPTRQEAHECKEVSAVLLREVAAVLLADPALAPFWECKAGTGTPLGRDMERIRALINQAGGLRASKTDVDVFYSAGVAYRRLTNATIVSAYRQLADLYAQQESLTETIAHVLETVRLLDNTAPAGDTHE